MTHLLRRPALGALGAAAVTGACYQNGWGRPRLQREGLQPSTGTARCDPAPNAVKSVTERLGNYVRHLDDENLIQLRSEKDGVKIYGVVDEGRHKAEGGLPVVRIAQATIKASVDDVAETWWNVAARKEWDSVNTEDSQLAKAQGPKQRLVYIQGKAKKAGVISSRDFCYTMYRLPAQQIGGRVGGALFVQVNSAGDLPGNKASVRGDVNSLLLLEPVDANTTKASYAIEMDVKGWIPTKVVNAAADETPLTLAVMRDHLEKSSAADQGLSPEEAARRRIQQRQMSGSVGEQGIRGSVTFASREDLLETKKLLEGQLKKLGAEEKKLGMKFTEARSKIDADLKDIQRRL